MHSGRKWSVQRWLDSQLDPEQLERLRARQERFAWMQKWDAFVWGAWAIMLIVGGLVWLALL